MTDDLFEAVRLAEEQAEKTLGDAQHEALKLIKETETRCADRERAVAREHRALYQSILEEKRKAMTQELNEAARAEREQIGRQMDTARQNLPSAVKCIAERVMSNGDR